MILKRLLEVQDQLPRCDRMEKEDSGKPGG